MSYIQEAFNLACKEAKRTQCWYVCLIASHRAYGGPEEGGWWYDVNHVEAYQEFASETLAEEAVDSVQKLAKALEHDAHVEHGEYCLRTMEWLEARGLDADWLPEPDGPVSYRVEVYNHIPQFNNRRPHYE